jgi:hypothetical protein
MTDVFVQPSATAPEAEEKNTTTVTVEARPSETPVTASEATAAALEPSQPETAADAGETRRRSGTPYSQRIGELTREKYELRSKIQELEARLTGAPSPTPDASRAEQPPRLDAFESYEQWVEAVADYRAEKRFRELQRQDEERQAQERERTAAIERRTTYETNVARAEQRYPDYHEVTAEMPVTPTMAQFLMAHEKGPDIAYYLGRSPDEAMRIALLDPVKQGYELARLEAKLTTPQQAAKTVTSAPDPINPVRPRASSPSGDPAKMSMGEYAAWRKKQMRDQRQR